MLNRELNQLRNTQIEEGYAKEVGTKSLEMAVTVLAEMFREAVSSKFSTFFLFEGDELRRFQAVYAPLLLPKRNKDGSFCREGTMSWSPFGLKLHEVLQEQGITMMILVDRSCGYTLGKGPVYGIRFGWDYTLIEDDEDEEEN